VVPPDLRFRLVKEPLAVENGYVRVPTTPGLGVALDEEEVARHRIEF
jgi:L-alanine-DL-glutamate epimerase-like enolase superfamily enzyme